MKHIDLSISIVSYNDREFLRNFLSSIYQNTKGVTFEVLVINNGDQDHVVDMIKNEFPKVDLIVNKENVFFTKATNQNLARAKGEFIVYLSSDTLACENSFLPMMELMKSDLSIGVVGPVLYDFTGVVHSPGQKFPTIFSTVLDFIGFDARFPMNKLWMNRHYRNRPIFSSFPVESVSGACLMTRRTVLDRVGLLDENLTMFYDEHDFCKRVRENGLSVFHCGDAEIKHYGHGTCEKEPSELIKGLMTASCLYLIKKYYGIIGYMAVLVTVKLIQTISFIKKALLFNRA